MFATDTRQADAANRDRKWLDEAGVLGQDSAGKAHQAFLGDNQLFGHTAIAAHAHDGFTATHAQVVVATHTAFAVAAVDSRFNGDRRAVRGDAGNFVAQGEGNGKALLPEVQVAAADARRGDPDTHTFAAGRRHIVDMDFVVVAAYGFHGGFPW